MKNSIQLRYKNEIPDINNLTNSLNGKISISKECSNNRSSKVSTPITKAESKTNIFKNAKSAKSSTQSLSYDNNK